jgi:hypothetical protein
MNNKHTKHRRQFLEYSRILSNYHESLVSFYENNLDEYEERTSLHPELESHLNTYLSKDCKNLLLRIQECAHRGTGESEIFDDLRSE